MSQRRHIQFRLVTVVGILAVLFCWTSQISLASTVRDFSGPGDFAVVGSKIWVIDGGPLFPGTNSSGLTEINPLNGTVVRTIHGPSDGLNVPNGIIAIGNRLWVTNGLGNSVSVINAMTGQFVALLNGSRYGFDNPTGIAFDGSHVWIANQGTDSVSELNASSGALVRVVSSTADKINAPYGLAIQNGHLWIANSASNSVTELSTSNGSLIGVLSGSRYGFSQPYDIASVGSSIWVMNHGFGGQGAGLVQLSGWSGSSGRLVHRLLAPQFGFPTGLTNGFANGMATSSTGVWIVFNQAIFQFNAVSGAEIRKISSPNDQFDGANDVAIFNNSIFVSNYNGNSLTQLSLKSDVVVKFWY